LIRYDGEGEMDIIGRERVNVMVRGKMDVRMSVIIKMMVRERMKVMVRERVDV
jgi:hypothetical protein